MAQLEGQVALVTGGGSGLGRAIVERFRFEGARVAILERSLQHGDELPADVVATVGDVRSAEDNERAVRATVEQFGRLDVFVGNAGIYDNRRAFDEYAYSELPAAFDELFGINVKGYLLGALAALPALRATRGSMIFTSSVSGSAAGFGGTLYIAAKHAINGITRQLAYELAPDVRVNAVAPGYVPTNLRGLTTLGQGLSKNPESVKTAGERLPLHVAPEAADYTDLYVMLAAPAARRTLTGTILTADGGISLQGPGPLARQS